MLFLDTTVFLDLRGRAGARRRAALELLRRLEHVGPRVTTRFNLAELYLGVELARDPVRERQIIDQLLQDVPIFEFDGAAMIRFSKIAAHLRRIGRPTGDMDMLIAAVAVTHSQTLVTRNPSHFVDVPGLVVESY